MKNTGMLFPTMSALRQVEDTKHGIVGRTKISLVRVEPRGKPVNITSSIGTTTASSNSGESHKNMRLFPWRAKEGCGCNVGEITVRLEDAMSSCHWMSTRVTVTLQTVDVDIPAPLAWTARSGT
jgi:hypothetical protein